MTSETPAHDRESAGAAPASTPPAARTRRTQPPSGSSGKHLLPNPWPQPGAPQLFPEAADVTATPTIASANWLPEPDYCLADHQSIPRPPTRPIPRPRRFRRMSRPQSALVAVIILMGVTVIGACMVEAGRISGDFFNGNFFNAPRTAPTTQPTTSAATPTVTTVTTVTTATTVTTTQP